MEHWIKKTTPQGKVYFGNSITHETTWDYNEIDISTGHLVKSFTHLWPHLSLTKSYLRKSQF